MKEKNQSEIKIKILLLTFLQFLLACVPTHYTDVSVITSYHHDTCTPMSALASSKVFCYPTELHPNITNQNYIGMILLFY